MQRNNLIVLYYYVILQNFLTQTPEYFYLFFLLFRTQIKLHSPTPFFLVFTGICHYLFIYTNISGKFLRSKLFKSINKTHQTLSKPVKVSFSRHHNISHQQFHNVPPHLWYKTSCFMLPYTYSVQIIGGSFIRFYLSTQLSPMCWIFKYFQHIFRVPGTCTYNILYKYVNQLLILIFFPT